MKLTHYDETEKRSHDSHIVLSKENLKLNNGGPSYRQEISVKKDIRRSDEYRENF